MYVCISTALFGSPVIAPLEIVPVVDELSLVVEAAVVMVATVDTFNICWSCDCSVWVGVVVIVPLVVCFACNCCWCCFWAARPIATSTISLSTAMGDGVVDVFNVTSIRLAVVVCRPAISLRSIQLAPILSLSEMGRLSTRVSFSSMIWKDWVGSILTMIGWLQSWILAWNCWSTLASNSTAAAVGTTSVASVDVTVEVVALVIKSPELDRRTTSNRSTAHLSVCWDWCCCCGRCIWERGPNGTDCCGCCWCSAMASGGDVALFEVDTLRGVVGKGIIEIEGILLR